MLQPTVLNPQQLVLQSPSALNPQMLQTLPVLDSEMLLQESSSPAFKSQMLKSLQALNSEMLQSPIVLDSEMLQGLPPFQNSMLRSHSSLVNSRTLLSTQTFSESLRPATHTGTDEGDEEGKGGGEKMKEGVVRVEVEQAVRAAREEDGAVYECRVTSPLLTTPLTTNVTLTVHCKYI